MKIVFLSSIFSPTGGVGSYVLRLTKALAAKGTAVTVIHNDANAVDPGITGVRQCRVTDFDVFESAESPAKIKEVMDVLKREEPDLVHVQANTHFELEAEIRKSFPAVKSLHVYDFCPSGNKFHQALGKTCHYSTGPMCIPRMIYKRCTTSWRPSTISMFYRRTKKSNQNDAGYSKILVASRYVRQEARASGYPAHQVEVIPYFAEVMPEGSADLEEEKTVMFTGRLLPEKGLGHLLRAMALLPQGLNWKLAVDGKGPVLNEMKRLAEKLRITPKVDFSGWLGAEEHHRLYQRASVVVMPSLWPEPFGLVGIEAMGYGKPVVAFDAGGISEWLEDQVTGFLVRRGDERKLAEKIQYLLEHPSEAKEMGRQGRLSVEKKFSLQNHLELLEAVYRRVIESFRPALLKNK